MRPGLFYMADMQFCRRRCYSIECMKLIEMALSSALTP